MLELKQVFAREVQKMKDEKIKPLEQLTLEPFERGECFVKMTFHSCVADWCYRPLHRDWKIQACWKLIATVECYGLRVSQTG